LGKGIGSKPDLVERAGRQQAQVTTKGKIGGVEDLDSVNMPDKRKVGIGKARPIS